MEYLFDQVDPGHICLFVLLETRAQGIDANVVVLSLSQVYSSLVDLFGCTVVTLIVDDDISKGSMHKRETKNRQTSFLLSLPTSSR